ncbi:VOC family protein [Nocardioides solisilvae]|uniref:VOC family protein n=1 Tax=Nocardioides solisilvae TaxID=1542435 RepID=UPI000D74580C|nr:VOC family protein [Nocardioides solisilvae]
MTARQIQVTFDCARPAEVAAFWAEVLGYAVPDSARGEEEWSACADPAGVGPRLYFQRVSEPKQLKNRVHVDVRAATGLTGQERIDALEAECARLVALGGTRVALLPAGEDNESCLVMQDVEGNEFCLD